MLSDMTKGPWTYDTGPALNGRHHSVMSGDEVMVCECYEGSEEEQAANAQAISALPELIEALNGLVALIRPHADTAEELIALEAADSALAKAGA